MVNSQVLKLQLAQEVGDLSDDQLQKVHDFVISLLNTNGKAASTHESPSGHDPLLDYIGGVSHGSLSANLDEDLYGKMR